MSKKMISAMVTLLLLISSVGSAFAAESSYVAQPRASAYLDGAYIALGADGNGKMSLSYVVFGTKLMDKVGVTKIVIEEYDGFEWHSYQTFGASYTYNDDNHAADVNFTGMPGLQYRAVLYAYAKNGSGSDTGVYKGSGTICK